MEARILEKYKGLMFFDPDTGKTFKVWGGNLEFHRGSRMTGVEKGWGLVCINEESEEEGCVLNEEVIELIGSHAQADEIEVIHQDGEGELEIAAVTVGRGFPQMGFFTASLLNGVCN